MDRTCPIHLDIQRETLPYRLVWATKQQREVAVIELRSELVTATELARELKVAPATIRSWFSKGRIPGHRLGRKVIRYKLADVVSALGAADADRRQGVGQ
jgi:excisionase family DNA binding protein